MYQCTVWIVPYLTIYNCCNSNCSRCSYCALLQKNLRKLTPNTQCDNLDKGQIVNVTSVNEDGSAKVNYRGTTWTAYADNGSLECGVYKIDRVEGTRLILKK